MAYPYSDNLYSMVDDESDIEFADDDGLNQPELSSQIVSQGMSQYPQAGLDGDRPGESSDVDDEEAEVLSPADGYFHAAPSVSSHAAPAAAATTSATSSNVPYIPNVWVDDPSLSQRTTAESKAREADEERLANRDPFAAAPSEYSFQPAPAPRAASSSIYSSPPSRSAPSSAYQRPGSAVYNQASSSSSSTASYSRSTAPFYPPHAPRRAAYNERSFFSPREAPPAYTPSPTSPTSSRQGSDSPTSHYGTFPHTIIRSPEVMGASQESELLLAHDPESMGGHSETRPTETVPQWRDRMRRRLSSRNGRKWKVLLLGLFAILMAAGILTSLIAGMDQGQRNKGGPGQNRPGKSPNEDTGANPEQPHTGYPELDDRKFRWQSPMCKDTQIERSTQTFGLSFDVDAEKQFTFLQDVTKEGGHYDYDIHIQGTVIVRSTGYGTPGSSVVVETTVNHDSLNHITEWDAEKQRLAVLVPRGVSWTETNSRPCMKIQATVWVPSDAVLEKLDIQTIHLDIKLMDNLSLKVSQATNLASVVGSITAASSGSYSHDEKLIDTGSPATFNLDSRKIEVETISASIRGSWPLYDYLGIRTTSGTIKVSIEPKEVDKETLNPAALYLKSLSGDIEFREPIFAATEAFSASHSLAHDQAGYTQAEATVPPRDYRVEVHSTSGHLKGSVAFSSTALIKSTSGGINVDMLPVLDSSLAESGGKNIYLKTTTTSGTTDITVLDPLWFNGIEGIYVDLPSAPSPPAPPSPPSPPSAPSRPAGVPGAEGEDQPDYSSIGKIGNDDPYSSISGREKEVQEQAEDVSALRCLYSEHITTSADIRLQYPASWEGDIALETMSGSLSVYGKDVRIVKSRNDWGGIGKGLFARKGDGGGSEVSAKATSGNVKILVGSP